jgi:hypothetical protein
MKSPSDTQSCPECQAEEPQLTAIVLVGRWERHFYKCPACAVGFAGSWQSTHDLTPAVLRHGGPVALALQTSAI